MSLLPTPYGKSKRTAMVLVLFLGWLGVHRFYLGHVNTAFAQLAVTLVGVCTFGVTLPFLGIWLLLDLAAITTGALSDSDGYPLT